MRDVAALSGVSLKTVSRVVNLEPGVSADLVERVQTAAAALQYRPNLTASSLRRSDGRTQTIGLVLENIANPYSSALHRAIEDIARSHEVVVFAGSVDEDPARERELAGTFLARQVDGLIVVPAGADQSYLAHELRAGTPMVFVDRPPNLLDADAVTTDNFAGARDAVRHLIAHGHRRIAYLGDLSSIFTAEQRLNGYLDALERAGIVLDADLIWQNLRSSDHAQTAIIELLTAAEPPTAVFASQNLVTIGAVRGIAALGKQFEIALVGFDDIPLADLVSPRVSLVIQDVHALGAAAAELLFDRINGSDLPTQRITLPVHLVTAGSGEITGPFAA